MNEFMDVCFRASKAIRAVTDTVLRRHGLHLGQNMVLAVLWEKDGQTPGAIAAALNVTAPTIVKMANRMTAAGLIVRRRDSRDNRLVRLHLTDAGRALREPIEEETRGLEQRLTAGLNEDEIHRLMDLMNSVIKNAQSLDPVDTTDAGLR